jgi:hypothetical protein
MAKVVKSPKGDTARAVTRAINGSKASGSTIRLTNGQRKAILDNKKAGSSHRGA